MIIPRIAVLFFDMIRHKALAETFAFGGRKSHFIVGQILITTVFMLIFGLNIAAQDSLRVQTDAAVGGADKAKSSETKIKVSFDIEKSGIVIVESNGEKLRIDTVNRTVSTIKTDPVEHVMTESAKIAGTPVESPKSLEKEHQEESAYDFDKGDEPYDYRLINVPTPKKVPKGTWNMAFTHRFTQAVNPISSSARNLLGLDSFGVASFGISYGITDKFYASVYRSPLCQKGLCRTIEIGLGYNWLEHDKDSPFALATYASVEGNGNFTEEYTYNLQARMSARVNKRVYLFFSPAMHLNSNGQRRFNPRPADFFPPASIANDFQLPAHTASFGFGTSVLVTPNIVALFEFTPRTGFKLGRITPTFDSNFNVIGFRSRSQPEIGFGIQRNIGKHSFALTFSNTQTTTTSRYNSSNLVLSPKTLVIGFNLSRRF